MSYLYPPIAGSIVCASWFILGKSDVYLVAAGFTLLFTIQWEVVKRTR